MKNFAIILCMGVMLHGAVSAQSKWIQPTWVENSPNYEKPYKSGYEFNIIQRGDSVKLFLYFEYNAWHAHIIDNLGRKYVKKVPEDVRKITFVNQHHNGTVYLLGEVSPTDIRIFKLISSGFTIDKKSGMSGNGITAFFYDGSRLYFATRGDASSKFATLVIFDDSWRKEEKGGKTPWQSFSEKPKGLAKEQLIKSEVINISKGAKGIVLLTESQNKFLLGDELKIVGGGLGSNSSFDVKKLE